MAPPEALYPANKKNREGREMKDSKVLVYEFCGWINTPDECAGEWFADFPHPTTVGKKRPEPRVSYYDHARGFMQSRNWQVYTMLVGMSYINTVTEIKSICRVEWEVAKLPQVKIHPIGEKPKSGVYRPGYMFGNTERYSDSEYYVPKIIPVEHFFDKYGNLYDKSETSKEAKDMLTRIVRELYNYDEFRKAFPDD